MNFQLFNEFSTFQCRYVLFNMLEKSCEIKFECDFRQAFSTMCSMENNSNGNWARYINKRLHFKFSFWFTDPLYICIANWKYVSVAQILLSSTLPTLWIGLRSFLDIHIWRKIHSSVHHFDSILQNVPNHNSLGRKLHDIDLAHSFEGWKTFWN